MFAGPLARKAAIAYITGRLVFWTRECEDKRMSYQIGRPVAWAARALRPQPGNNIPLDVLFADYVAWCEASNQLPLRAGVFREMLIELAKKTGIAVHRDGTDVVMMDLVCTR